VSPRRRTHTSRAERCHIIIVVVIEVSHYNCVYYCDTCYLLGERQGPGWVRDDTYVGVCGGGCVCRGEGVCVGV
jgi:hypothetical protein